MKPLIVEDAVPPDVMFPLRVTELVETFVADWEVTMGGTIGVVNVVKL